MPTGLQDCMFQAGRMFFMAGFAAYIVCTKIFIFKNSFWFCKEFEWTFKCGMDTVEIKRVFLFLLKPEFSHLREFKILLSVFTTLESSSAERGD